MLSQTELSKPHESGRVNVMENMAFKSKFIKVNIIHSLLPIGLASKKNSYSGSTYYVTCILVLRNL